MRGFPVLYDRWSGSKHLFFHFGPLTIFANDETMTMTVMSYKSDELLTLKVVPSMLAVALRTSAALFGRHQLTAYLSTSTSRFWAGTYIVDRLTYPFISN